MNLKAQNHAKKKDISNVQILDVTPTLHATNTTVLEKVVLEFSQHAISYSL